MELAGTRVAVFGLGITGQATLRFLKRQGAVPVAVDELTGTAQREALEDLVGEYEVEAHFGDFPPEVLADCELVILSPGVRPDAPKLAAARAAGRGRGGAASAAVSAADRNTRSRTGSRCGVGRVG